MYGEYTFQGAYIYHLSIENGFEFDGRITHMQEDDYLKSGYYPNYDLSIIRTLYIENVLYTISDSFIKMNDLDDLRELNIIEFE